MKINTIHCPHCRTLLEIVEATAGKTVICPACKQTFPFAPKTATPAASGTPGIPTEKQTAKPRPAIDLSAINWHTLNLPFPVVLKIVFYVYLAQAILAIPALLIWAFIAAFD